MITHPVHRCVLRPLLLCWVERKLLALTVLISGGIYTVTGWLSLGLLALGILYYLSWWVTKTDPAMLRILWASRNQASRYDAGKVER